MGKRQILLRPHTLAKTPDGLYYNSVVRRHPHPVDDIASVQMLWEAFKAGAVTA